MPLKIAFQLFYKAYLTIVNAEVIMQMHRRNVINIRLIVCSLLPYRHEATTQISFFPN